MFLVKKLIYFKIKKKINKVDFVSSPKCQIVTDFGEAKFNIF